MRKFITLLWLFTLLSCQTESRNSSDGQGPLKNVDLFTPSGERIETTLAITPKDQELGLSGVKPEDFEDNQGLLFFYLEDDEKNFWMPDTYFDLDLVYLDKDLKIVDIIRKLPFYVGRANPQLIPRARPVWCRHALEMKSTSKISQKLKIGDVLKWSGKLSLEETNVEAKKLLEKI